MLESIAIYIIYIYIYIYICSSSVHYKTCKERIPVAIHKA